MSFKPSYIDLYERGILQERAQTVETILGRCTLCPHQCGVDRTKSEIGRCRTGMLPMVASFSPHFGEEPPLVGRRGSGTIFFTNCNLSCIFCQNHDISQGGAGREVSFKDLALMMMSLQNEGCHNINFVTPTHMVYAVLKSLCYAVKMGLCIPLVYNSGGYDSVETLKVLEGVFDIYMPDFKYADAEVGFKLSGIERYPEIAKAAITEMHRQVGDLECDKSGIAFRGLIVRHLILPGNLAGTEGVIDFMASLSKNTYFNLMDQYRPEYKARDHRDIGRRLSLVEYDDFVQSAREKGLYRLAD